VYSVVVGVSIRWHNADMNPEMEQRRQYYHNPADAIRISLSQYHHQLTPLMSPSLDHSLVATTTSIIRSNVCIPPHLGNRSSKKCANTLIC